MEDKGGAECVDQNICIWDSGNISLDNSSLVNYLQNNDRSVDAFTEIEDIMTSQYKHEGTVSKRKKIVMTQVRSYNRQYLEFV